VTIYDLASAHIQDCGASESDAEAILLEFGAVDAINHATSEQIAQAMESLPTDALEFAVGFEALSHTEPQFPPAPRAGTARSHKE
jgi:hypothetical protein